jgi:hypothetical protein
MSRRCRAPEPDCYDYVRRYYGVPAYIGVRVQVGEKEGVIVKSNGSPYVHIKLDGAKHANPYHPTDPALKYLIERRAGIGQSGGV